MNNAQKLFKLEAWDEGIRLPVPLPKSVSINQKLCEQFLDAKSVNICETRAAFHSTDARYLRIEAGETIHGLVQSEGWVFGYVQGDCKRIGFLPASYLLPGIIKAI